MKLSQTGSSGSVYKNKLLRTVSGTFTVPAGVFKIKLGAQSGGASGRSSPGGGANFSSGGHGGHAGSYVSSEFDVQPGDVITYEIGAGGPAPSSSNNGNSGGNTVVRIGSKTLLIVEGAQTTNEKPLVPAGSLSTACEIIQGGWGGAWESAGVAGSAPRITSLSGYAATYTTTVLPVLPSFGVPVAPGGGTNGGSGGGSSIFGPGAPGGTYLNDAPNAPSTSYGAGGGGGGGDTINNWNNGSAGIQGCLEIYY